MNTGYIRLLVETKFDQEVGRWVAGSRQLRVFSQGDSPQEALQRSVDAISLFLNHETERGRLDEIIRSGGIEWSPAPASHTSMRNLLGWIRSTLEGYNVFPVTLPYPRAGAAVC